LNPEQQCKIILDALLVEVVFPKRMIPAIKSLWSQYSQTD